MIINWIFVNKLLTAMLNVLETILIFSLNLLTDRFNELILIIYQELFWFADLSKVFFKTINKIKNIFKDIKRSKQRNEIYFFEKISLDYRYYF